MDYFISVANNKRHINNFLVTLCKFIDNIRVCKNNTCYFSENPFQNQAVTNTINIQTSKFT